MDDPIPIELFEPAMPAAMRPLIEAAKKGEGELAWLLTEEGRRGGPVQQMLRLARLPPEITGWAAGISMFFAHPRYVIDIMAMHDVTAPMPFLLEALGAGLAAGVECPIDLWKCIQLLAERHALPDSLVRTAHAGLISDSSIARKAALAVALRQPLEAQKGIEAARQKKLTLKETRRLDDALGALGVTPASPAPARNPLLERLIEAWARSFDERLVAGLVAVGAAESAQRGALSAASKGELESAWLALAKKRDPGDVARLLATPWPAAWRAALARVQALEQFPPDPRIAAAVNENASRYTSRAGLAVRAAAERVAFKMHRPKLREAPEELLREVAKLTPHQSDLDALWTSFWEDPGDEGKRAVLADALQSAGDPRGELISLQLALERGAADLNAQKRIDALLDQHIDTWSGGLPGVVPSSREFRRGFLSAAVLKPEPEHLVKSVERREWRTIERLKTDFGRADEQDLGALFGRMPSLRALLFETINDFWFSNWKAEFPQVKLLGTNTWLPGKRLEQFPSLEMLCLSAHPQAALEAAWHARLKGVMLMWHPLQLALSAFESLMIREVVELRSAEEMGSDYEPRGWTIRVRREHPERAQLFHSGRYKDGSFAAVAKVLADNCRTTLHIHCPVALKKKLEAEPIGNAELSWSHLPFDVFLPPPIS